MNTCKHFGVRTSKREEESRCQRCKDSNLDLFKKCTVESNITMGTSTDVDEAGKTVFIPPKIISDTVLLYEKFGETHSSLCKETDSDDKPSNELKPKRKITPRVKGLAKLCRNLRSEGKSDDEIRQAVAKRYVEAGKSEKDAKGKAKNWVKNMNWNEVRTGRFSSTKSEADFFGADLSGADLSGANLSEANLSEADLSNLTNLMKQTYPKY